MYVCEGDRERERVCMCVREKEREIERERVPYFFSLFKRKVNF